MVFADLDGSALPGGISPDYSQAVTFNEYVVLLYLQNKEATSLIVIVTFAIRGVFRVVRFFPGSMDSI